MKRISLQQRARTAWGSLIEALQQAQLGGYKKSRRRLTGVHQLKVEPALPAAA